MKAVDQRVLCFSAALLVASAVGFAQNPPQNPPAAPPDGPTAAINSNDPRVGLKPGYRNAGVAAKNMELLASVPKPGPFEPKDILEGAPTATPDAGRGSAATPPPTTPPATPEQPAAATAAPPAPPAGRGGPRGLDFANSDLAFRRADMFLGNFNGFNTYDIETPKKPRLLASVVCPAGRATCRCTATCCSCRSSRRAARRLRHAGRHRDGERRALPRRAHLRHQRHQQAEADRGGADVPRLAHAHAGHDPKDKDNIYVYGSGTSTVRPATSWPAARRGARQGSEHGALQHRRDPGAAVLARKAKIVNRPRIFADLQTGAIAGLEKGSERGPGTQTVAHHQPVPRHHGVPEVGLAAGACSGNGILLDISDPCTRCASTRVRQELRLLALGHVQQRRHEGDLHRRVGRRHAPRCRATDLLNWGADAIFDIVDKKLQFRGYYKMPAPQTEQENCVAHNGSLIPVPGRDIMVQAWYQGGCRCSTSPTRRTRSRSRSSIADRSTR
jgi:hypothetical protein